MPSARWKVGRNEPCPCGSGQKAKFCCSPRDIADDAQFLAGLSERGTRELDELCEDCQTEAWFDVLDLPDAEEACRLAISAPRPGCVVALQEALSRGNPDAVADELPAALAAVDSPVARARLARGVLALEAAGRARPAVAEAALADLVGGQPSLLLMASLLAALSAEVGLRPRRLAALKPALREGRLFEPQRRPVRCRRKPATSGRQ